MENRTTAVIKEQFMVCPFLNGNGIYMRSLVSTDLDGPYFDWLNDREVTKYMDSGVFPNTKEAMETYFNNVARNPDNVMLAIVDKSSENHVGNIRLGTINWISRVAPIGIMIGAKDYWGNGYGTEAIIMVSDYAFGRLNLYKITAGIAAGHQASLKAFQKCGFVIEGKALKEQLVDGDYQDILHLGKFSHPAL
jgi:RimJ/RimL family protein N-acetyltransferase